MREREMMVSFFSFDSVSFFRFAFCLVLQNRKRMAVYNGPDFDSSGSDHNHLHSLSLEPSISCFSVHTFLENKKKHKTLGIMRQEFLLLLERT